MQTKLTLRLDDALVRRAKKYAAQTGTSVSQLVADYFAFMGRQVEKPQEDELSPTVRSLYGVLKDSGVDESDYYRHLEEKYK